MLKEKKMPDCNEFRIVYNIKCLIGIALLSIFVLLSGLCEIIASNDISFIIIECIAALYILVSILRVEKTYLSMYIIPFILISINFLVRIVFSVRGIFIKDIFIMTCFVLSVYAVVLFYKILNGKNKKPMLILVLLLMLCAEIMYYEFEVGFDRWKIFNFYSWQYIGLFVCLCFPLMILLLFVLSISNSPDKIYISETESGGKNIKTHSIGISVILSVLTFGLYYLMWTYRIISDIRKLEGKKGTAVGEWLLYNIVPIYDLVWLYTKANSLSVIGENNKIKSNGGGGFFIFMHIIFLDIVNMALLQSTLNDLARVMDDDFVYGTFIQQDYMKTTQSIYPNTNYMESLKELNELKKSGIITEEEFAEKKAYYLEKM